MHHIRFVQEVDGTEDVVNYGNHMILCELNCVCKIEYALEIVFLELHDDEDVAHVVWCPQVHQSDREDVLGD